MLVYGDKKLGFEFTVKNLCYSLDKEKIEVSCKKGNLVKRDENDICDNEVRSTYNLITKFYL